MPRIISAIVSMFILTLLATPLTLAETRGINIIAKDATTGQTGEVQIYRKTFAVIIGIDRYPNLPPDKQLKNATHDAKGVEEVLRRNYRFDEIVTLFDEQATKDRIMEVLTEELPAKMTKDDALFLFWAGHGNQEKSEFGELGYLIPYDGSIDKIRKNLTMSELRDTISKKMPAKHAFYVMDACYSGLLTTTRSLDNKPKRDLAYLQEITKESVRQVLTAGGKGEEALDGGPKGHSVFTGRLIEALEAAGDFVTANEIQAILREKVFQDARERNHTQTPGFGTLYGAGDFVFVPNLQQKGADVAAEVAKLEAELATLQRREDAAKQSLDEAARHEAERQKQVTEAKLRAEKLRQEQVAEETLRQEAQRQEQARFDAETKRQEAEQAAKRSEEEQRLVKLKAEIKAKRQVAPIGQSETVEATVAEIKRLSAEIDSIEAAFLKEKQAGDKRINDRYPKLIADVRAREQAAKSKPLVKDMFETAAEFSERKKKSVELYAKRRLDLEGQQQAELVALHQRIDRESADQTAPLRRELLALTNKEFILDPNSLALDVGRYDVDKGVFPFTLTNISATVDGKAKNSLPVKVAMNGTIRMARDDAKEWWGQMQDGFIYPEVTYKYDGQVVKVELANDISADLQLRLRGKQFILSNAIIFNSVPTPYDPKEFEETPYDPKEFNEAPTYYNGISVADLINAERQDSSNKGKRGVVTEVLLNNKYTYIRVDTGGEKFWAAAPEFKVKVGDSVYVPHGMPMTNYESSTLKMVLDVIYFLDAINVEKSVAQTHFKISGIKKAGATVSELFENSARLDGKRVSVRGKVAKYSPEIMGWNWIHLQDGTGKEGSNDLSVTTKAVAKVGDTVLINGNVITNKDFGYGYIYDVIIEDADVKVE